MGFCLEVSHENTEGVCLWVKHIPTENYVQFLVPFPKEYRTENTRCNFGILVLSTDERYLVLWLSATNTIEFENGIICACIKLPTQDYFPLPSSSETKIRCTSNLPQRGNKVLFKNEDFPSLFGCFGPRIGNFWATRKIGLTSNYSSSINEVSLPIILYNQAFQGVAVI